MNNPEISRLAAKLAVEMTLDEKTKLIPYVEKAKTLADIPQPWRDQMQALKDAAKNPYDGEITEH